MTIQDSNTLLAKKLRDAYSTECNESRRISLPSQIKFTQDGNTVKMYLQASSLKKNMQENQASFEGWALAIKRWLPKEISNIELSWEHFSEISDPHYQRFLYRVKHFQSLFKDWFKISPQNIHEIGNLKTEEKGRTFCLNVPSKPRSSKLSDQTNSLDSAMKTEHKLECFIVEHQKTLCDLLEIDKVDRQLPVGVFRDRVSSKAEHGVFTCGHSAIDIWGINESLKNLFLFELKKTRNQSIGILSEMFFYSYVMLDVQIGRFKFHTANPAIELTKSITTYILAPKWHPLIDKNVLMMVNKAFEKSALKIQFGAIKIENKKEPYSLSLI